LLKQIREKFVVIGHWDSIRITIILYVLNEYKNTVFYLLFFLTKSSFVMKEIRLFITCA